MPTDTMEHLRDLFVAWRRARIREANELGALADVPGVVRSLTDEEWAEIRRLRRERTLHDE